MLLVPSRTMASGWQLAMLARWASMRIICMSCSSLFMLPVGTLRLHVPSIIGKQKRPNPKLVRT